jgi:SAM domain (Sterile alpha motif)
MGLRMSPAIVRFRHAEVLPDLTEGDLNQLGVPLGHRKRLLKAIAALGTAETATKPSCPAPASSPTGTAERRPITVMFCDLVGSTSLAAKLDAEDWRDLVGAYLDEASAAVTRLAGHVLKRLGDCSAPARAGETTPSARRALRSPSSATSSNTVGSSPQLPLVATTGNPTSRFRR